MTTEPTLQIDPVFLKVSNEKEEPERHTTLAEMERKYILQVVEDKKWIISGKNGAARILDLNEATLRSKMKKLGIKKPAS